MNRREETTPLLQPLRIPDGWFVENNSFLQSKDTCQEAAGESGGTIAHLSLLTIVHSNQNVSIRVGHSPQNTETQGGFFLHLSFRSTANGKPIGVFRTHRWDELITRLEFWLSEIHLGKDVSDLPATAPGRLSHENPQLQPLRIPTGWLVSYNNALYEVDVDSGDIDKEYSWHFFKEDMLLLKCEELDRSIDLGFYPEGDLEKGAYGLVLYEGNFERTIAEFSTRDRCTLVDVLERWMRDVMLGRDP